MDTKNLKVLTSFEELLKFSTDQDRLRCLAIEEDLKQITNIS
jgi:hypothetical protein